MYPALSEVTQTKYNFLIVLLENSQLQANWDIIFIVLYTYEDIYQAYPKVVVTFKLCAANSSFSTMK